jgi:uncharacterized protein YegL
MTNFSTTNTHLQFGNFDPEKMEEDEVINVVLAVDVSISMHKNKEALNKAYSEFVDHFKGSHIAEKLYISRIEFNSSIQTHTGFQPVGQLGPIDFGANMGGATALYDAVKEGLENAVKYRTDCEDSGVNVKTLLFVLTDGEDNSSASGAATDISDSIKTLLSEERNFASFTTILLGLGNQIYFEEAYNKMGLDHLAVAGDSAEDIRKMIGFISSSISSVSSGGSIPTF